MRRQVSAECRDNILSIATGHEQRGDEDLAQHIRALALRGAFGLAETQRGGAAGDAAVGMGDEDHVVLLDIKNGEEHALEHVVGVVLRSHLLAAACA